MQKILIYSTSSSDALQLKQFIETRLPFEANTVDSLAEAESILTNRPVQLFVWDMPTFRSEELQYIKDLRLNGYTYPLLVTSSEISKPDMTVAVEKHKTHFLERPFEFKNFKGIIRKLMIQRGIKQQFHRRFRTNQQARLETYLTAETIQTNMFNLSMGGAYLELNEKPTVAVGDMVKLEIALSDVSRQHKMPAKVIWTTRKGAFMGGYGVGIKFVKENEIYRLLMDKV